MMVREPICSPDKRGAIMARDRTASVVAFNRSVRPGLVVPDAGGCADGSDPALRCEQPINIRTKPINNPNQTAGTFEKSPQAKSMLFRRKA